MYKTRLVLIVILFINFNVFSQSEQQIAVSDTINDLAVTNDVVDLFSISLSDDEKSKGVVAASAGNHSQGVAFASKIEGIPCTIVMPKTASPAKVSATKGYGAKVVLEGSTYDESWAHAQKIAK